MSRSIILSLLLLSIIFSPARADSPLTSTPFSKAYKDVPIIIKASETSGQLTPDLIEYLTGLGNPIDIKVALINQLGWDKEVQNAEIFFNTLAERKAYTDFDQFLSKGEGIDYDWCEIYRITERWKDVENPLDATFSDYSQDGIIHLVFTDQEGRNHDFGSGNNMLSDIRLYGPQSGISNPDYLGKKFKITWDWKVSRTWFFWDGYEQAIAPLPSIVHIEIIE